MDFMQLLLELDVNTEVLLERFSGNMALVQRFICKFPTEETFSQLRIAYENKQAEELKIAAHTLKGIAANLGFEKLCLCCTALLDDLRESEMNVDENFAAVALEYERLITLIEAYSRNADR